MNYLSKFFFLAVAVSALLITGCTDDSDDDKGNITVSGVVVDTDCQTPIEGATITASGATTTSDSNGQFTLEDVAADGVVTISADSYNSSDFDAATSLNASLDFIYSFETYFTDSKNSVEDPNTADLSIDVEVPTDNFFDVVNYKGAGQGWWAGWSFYEDVLVGNNSDPITTGNIVDIVSDPSGTGTTTWTKDNTYVLDGFVFVNAGQTLTIEAGTVIQGKSGEDVDASALIVAKGGKIIAEGTADDPIIFTYEGDTGNTPASESGLWGGLIILGNSTLNTIPAEQRIEGIPENEDRGLFGGSDEADNSGILRYVSIRHGGTNIGADNEINGLTLGGVGSGTTIEYVEVVGNKDDGIEWFGGTVNGKYLLSIFCKDDGLDYDMGYRGKNQFVVVHQDPAEAGSGGEHDGGTSPEDGTPYAIPHFYNVTSIGNADEKAIVLRDNAGGFYVNSTFEGYFSGIQIEDLCDTDQDSRAQFEAGNIGFRSCVFWINEGSIQAADVMKLDRS